MEAWNATSAALMLAPVKRLELVLLVGAFGAPVAGI